MGHAGSNTAAVQSNSVTDKRCPNFLEGISQKAGSHLLPAHVPHSKQLEIALKCTGKPELTSEPFPHSIGYPIGRRSAVYCGRMLSHPPYRYMQLHIYKL